MLDHLAPGDVVTVTRIDRLARSTLDLFGIVKQIVDAKAQFRSLAEPWADTGTSTGRLMLAVLGGLADVERDLIRTRTAEGRSRAKAQGKHMGRPRLGDTGKAGDVRSRVSARPALKTGIRFVREFAPLLASASSERNPSGRARKHNAAETANELRFWIRSGGCLKAKLASS